MRKKLIVGMIGLLILALGGVAGATEVGGKYLFGTSSIVLDGSQVDESSSTGYVLEASVPVWDRISADFMLGSTKAKDWEEFERAQGEATTSYLGLSYALNSYFSVDLGYSAGKREMAVDFEDLSLCFLGLERLAVQQEMTGWRIGLDLKYPLNEKLTVRASGGYLPKLDVRNSVGLDISFLPSTQVQFTGSPDYSLTLAEQGGFAYDLDLGLSYNLRPNLTLDGGYRFTHLTESFDNGLLGALNIPDLVLEDSSYYLGLTYKF